MLLEHSSGQVGGVAGCGSPVDRLWTTCLDRARIRDDGERLDAALVPVLEYANGLVEPDEMGTRLLCAFEIPWRVPPR